MYQQFKKIQKHMSILILKKLEIHRNIVVSDQAGQSNIMSRLKSIGIQIEKNDPKIKKLLMK